MESSSKVQAEGVLFTASDVLQFAIRMEEDGGIFYREAADRSEKFEVKKLFNSLASEEAEHKKTFEKFLSKVTEIEPREEYPGEYLAYLHNYIDGKIFVPLDNKSAMSESSNVATALEYAIQREMESIHYYQELKAFVPDDDCKTLDKIINEERKHFMQLSEAKKNLT
ncbi:MAG TPA: ferritin family protein [Geobacteraceae bacterium]|nr:ferritin family protein [Geobacteraceae bacterium]